MFCFVSFSCTDFIVYVIYVLQQFRWADNAEAEGRDGKKRSFNHPFLQAVAMFFGEFLCFLAFKAMYLYYKRKDYTEEQLPESVKGNRDFSPFIFLPPALCDMTATSLM